MDSRERHLRELMADPILSQIIDKLEDGRPIPKWKGISDKDIDQHENWIYNSGRSDERDYILKLLHGEI